MQLSLGLVRITLLVPADKPGRDAHLPADLHEKHGQVPAGADPFGQQPLRGQHAGLVALLALYVLENPAVQVQQKVRAEAVGLGGKVAGKEADLIGSPVQILGMLRRIAAGQAGVQVSALRQKTMGNKNQLAVPQSSVLLDLQSQ